MTKHAKKSPRLQAVERPPAATVQIPLPVLAAFASIERSYFDLCIRAGHQVLAAMMEQDRTELCGPRWKRDPDRRAGRAGTAPSEVTLGGRRIQMTRHLHTRLSTPMPTLRTTSAITSWLRRSTTSLVMRVMSTSSYCC